MEGGLFQADVENRGLVLDPRSKLLLLIMMAWFVLGGAAYHIHSIAIHLFCALPAIMLLSAKKWKQAVFYIVIYVAAYSVFAVFGSLTHGIINSLFLATCGIITAFLPSIMMAQYVLRTTTVSEFTAAMLRLHLSEKIIIPLSVMFRFFPTVFDEFNSINAAMRMREVRFGGKNVFKMLEYRFVPLMTCCAKIGEELSAAALTRGLGGDVRRTNVCKIGFKLQDFIIILFCLMCVALLVLHYLGIWRYGT